MIKDKKNTYECAYDLKKSGLFLVHGLPRQPGDLTASHSKIKNQLKEKEIVLLMVRKR